MKTTSAVITLTQVGDELTVGVKYDPEPDPDSEAHLIAANLTETIEKMFGQQFGEIH